MKHGYFYASNVHCLPQSYIQRVYRYAEQLHALPAEEKRRCARPAGTYSGSDAPGKWRFFDIFTCFHGLKGDLKAMSVRLELTSSPTKTLGRLGDSGARDTKKEHDILMNVICSTNSSNTVIVL